MNRVTGSARARRAAAAALLSLPVVTAGAAAQGDRADGVRRPDRWFVVSTVDDVTRERTPRMLYIGRDGTILIAQCAAREGRKTGGWALTVQRDDWSFRTDFLEGWWSVDEEPFVGPQRWGGSGAMIIINDDALKTRLQQPVRERVVLRAAQGLRQWEVELAPRDLDRAVEQFAPSCEVTS
jgi:hypothetical protein